MRLTIGGLSLAALMALVGSLEAKGTVDWRTSIPITRARAWADSRPFDVQLTSFMAARNIPGAALAVTRRGRLVLANGYGYANARARRPVAPDALFRIASVSKPVTAAAVLRLAELHPDRMTLDTPVMSLLQVRPHLTGGAKADARLAQITVRMLLQHTAGWDRDKSGDPMFQPLEIAAALGMRAPPGPRDVVRYMLARELDFDPGTRYAYSNFGYCVLGRLIEDVTGQAYERFVQDQLLGPWGITRMRLGRTLASGRRRGEVTYYDPGEGRNVMVPGDETPAPQPYGCWHLEAMDAHGGWIASAPDLVRFASAFDHPKHCPVLAPESIETMFACPPGAAGHEADGSPKAAYYGCGWMVRPTADGRANTWHGGSLPGTHTLLVRRHDGLNWAALFSQRADETGLGYDEIDSALHGAADAIEDWPSWNLFDQGDP